MKKLFITLLFCAGLATLGAFNQVFAQEKLANPIATTYQETPAKINDLVHTKLAVSFDYKKRYLYGKEWLTLKPSLLPNRYLKVGCQGHGPEKHLHCKKTGKTILLNLVTTALPLPLN